MNKIEGTRPDISEYGFVRLYSATIISQGKNPIFENHKLEKDLYKYYDKAEYNFLFEDIVKREDKIFKRFKCWFRSRICFRIIIATTRI